MLKQLCLPVAVLLAIVACGNSRREAQLPYLGEQITVSHGHPDFIGACRTESLTLAPAEALRVERLLLGAPLSGTFVDRKALVDATSDLKFYGFGLSESTHSQADGSTLTLIQIEVPCRDKDRVLTLKTGAAGLTVVDDFVHLQTVGPIASVVATRSSLAYNGPAGNTVLTRPTALP